MFYTYLKFKGIEVITGSQTLLCTWTPTGRRVRPSFIGSLLYFVKNEDAPYFSSKKGSIWRELDKEVEIFPIFALLFLRFKEAISIICPAFV